MVKFAAPVFVAALLAASAAASTVADINDFESRDVAEYDEFTARDLELLSFAEELLSRDYEDLDMREFQEQVEELIARDPKFSFKKFLGKAFGFAKKIFFRREVEEAGDVAAREVDVDELEAREFEEYDARDLQDLEEMFERDLDFDSELLERDYAEFDDLD
ncbi:hypothetical protein H1R20_g12403, partial [Candolleomyces eurysporus]